MKGIKSFWNAVFLTALIVGSACFVGTSGHFFNTKKVCEKQEVTPTDYGNFLAAQHALYINDFGMADDFVRDLKSEVKVVNQTKILSSFFNGNMPENVKDLKSDKDLANRLIYDAYLINQDKWADLYQRHAKENTLMIAPIRIFSAVKQGKTKEALKFIDSLKTTDNWKSFMRGQVAVLNKDIDKAAKEFAKVHPDFMNINDYLYLMSFYKEHEMFEDMDILQGDFAAKPGGMFILNYEDIPDWSEYDGYKNSIAFSMIQTVSHAHIIILTDLSLMLLRFAESLTDANANALNYYLGQYYFYNYGDSNKSFNSIDKASPFYLFGQMRIAEKENNFKKIEKIAKNNPLFIQAVDEVLTEYIRNGNKKSALKLINSGLKHPDLSDAGRAYFLKQRAHVYLLFNDPDKAQTDVFDLMDLDGEASLETMLLQARVWNQKDMNLDDAYTYAMAAVKRNTSDIEAWDLVGVIVEKREGIDAALDLIEQVSGVPVNVSSLYEHLGDFYVKKGEKEKAKKSYLRAIDLSDDGWVVVPFVKKKLRKVK